MSRVCGSLYILFKITCNHVTRNNMIYHSYKLTLDFFLCSPDFSFPLDLFSGFWLVFILVFMCSPLFCALYNNGNGQCQCCLYKAEFY